MKMHGIYITGPITWKHSGQNSGKFNKHRMSLVWQNYFVIEAETEDEKVQNFNS